MMVTARSTPNIALMKYWGNRNDDLRLPAADSLSMTLDSPHAEITVDVADALTVQSDRAMKEKDRERFHKHLDLTKMYLQTLGASFPSSVSISIRSDIPPAIGIASSAAVFSALANAYAELVKGKITLSDEQISVIARFGSGSAARSIYGGYGALLAGTGDELDSSCGMQIANEDHWVLHDIVIIPSQEEKKVGSTEGHALAWTSPLFKKRLEAMPRRNQECRDAILQRDFEKLQRVAEEDSMDMHRVMETSTPPLNYLSEATHRIIKEVTAMRESENIPILFTMDAGPTVHLFCPEDAVNVVQEFAQNQADCRILQAKTGKGAYIL